jgi:hypothetical protein
MSDDTEKFLSREEYISSLRNYDYKDLTVEQLDNIFNCLLDAHIKNRKDKE